MSMYLFTAETSDLDGFAINQIIPQLLNALFHFYAAVENWIANKIKKNDVINKDDRRNFIETWSLLELAALTYY